MSSSTCRYSGISVGWGWDDVDSALRNNVVRYNDVQRVMNLMADGGGIYTLSKQPGTLIAENYVHDIARTSVHGDYPMGGIYLDEGSNLITVRDNVLQNTDDVPVHQNANGPNNTFINNNGFSTTVIANAGLESSFHYLREGVGGLPSEPLPSPLPGDTTAPVIALTAPGDGSTVSGTVSVAATASDAVGVVGVQFFVNGGALGAEDTSAPYAIAWNSTGVANGGPYELSAQARDAANNRTSAVVNVTVSNAVTGAGLVAAYNFNEGAGSTVTDRTGLGHAGTIAGATWTTQGRFGGALTFDGVNDWVTVADANDLDFTAGMTLEAWVYPTAMGNGSWRTVLLKERPGGETYNLYAHATNVTATYVVRAAEPSVSLDARGPSPLAVNTWTHLAATYDGSMLRLYVNGTQVGTRTVAGPLLTSSGVLRLGGNSVWGEYFSGRLDEIRIYNRALSADEIQTDLNRAVASDEAGAPSEPLPSPPSLPGDTTAPVIALTAPGDGSTVSGTVSMAATASDAVGVVGVQFFVNGGALGAEDTSAPYAIAWNSTGVANGGPYELSAQARDAANNRTSAVVHVTVSNAVTGAGLVAAYNFNEGAGSTVTDRTGLGHAGTIAGATWTTQGRFGGALTFDGVNDWVTVADANDLDFTAGMTLEAWVYPTAMGNGSWRTVLLKERPGGETYNLYAHATNVTATYVVRAAQPSVSLDARGPSPLAVNTWTHLAATYDGSMLRLYVNGTQVGTRTVAGPLLTSSGVLRLGGNSVWGEYFSGRLDEIRIYNRALSAGEIQTDLNRAVASDEAGAPSEPLPSPLPGDTTAPVIALTAPGDGSTVSGTVSVAATASDAGGVVGVQFFVNGAALGAEDTAAPYAIAWNSTGVANGGPYELSAQARDAANNRTSAVVHVTVSNAVTGAGLVAAYNFNEGAGSTVTDRTGLGHAGTIAGATWTTQGRFGGALTFDGVNDWVTVADANDLDFTAGMTLEAWVYPTAMGNGSWRTVLLKERPGGETYNLYAHATNVTATYVVRAAQPSVPLDARGPSPLAVNTWTHLAATYDGSTLRLYVNGTEVGTRTVAGPLLTSSGVLRLGGNSVWGEYFSGRLDEIRIYNRALTTAEIQANMTTPVQQ